jgi:archaetidylinositol phosphate synthase
MLSLAAAALLAYRYFIAAIVMIAISGLADAFDGIVARVQSKASRFGDFLDHVGDRVSDTALAAGWMMGNDVRESIVVTAVVLVMLNGYIGTQIEATWRERSYEAMGRGEFVLALIVFPIVSSILWRHGWQSIALGGFTIAELLSLLLLIFALLGIAQRFALARRLD